MLITRIRTKTTISYYALPNHTTFAAPTPCVMRKSRLITLYFLQYLPVVATLIMTVHCGLLILGVDINIAENAFGFSVLGCVMLLLFSHIFHFCWLHRCFVIYPTLVELCINIKPLGFFDGWLTEARWMMFVLGCMPLIYLLTHFNKYRKCYERQSTKAIVGCPSHRKQRIREGLP